MEAGSRRRQSRKSRMRPRRRPFGLRSLHHRRSEASFPSPFNYPVDIKGAWASGQYRFIQRYRSGHDENTGEEFDVPFARIDRVDPDRFDIYWMRHTGQWWKFREGVSFAKALKLLETEEILHPLY